MGLTKNKKKLAVVRVSELNIMQTLYIDIWQAVLAKYLAFLAQ